MKNALFTFYFRCESALYLANMQRGLLSILKAKILNRLPMALIFCLYLLNVCPPAFAYKENVLSCSLLPETMLIDQVWGGVRVGYDAQETDKYIYVSYYDANRNLAVSQIDKCSGTVKKVVLPSHFSGWDSHNKIVLGLDSAGRIHLSGNMHVTPLTYARMDKPNNVSSLAMLRPMTGLEEHQTTYPNFFHFSDGALGFSYRSGKSGDGREFVNRFDGTDWHRWIADPIFASGNTQQTVNAYHTGFIPGPDGFFHIAWVWRENSNVESNFHINYAKSQDLKTWRASDGKPLSLPITPANAEIIDPVPQKSGLFNNIKLGFDSSGRPVISYLKFDEKGFSQLFHARLIARAWETMQSTDWSFRWDPRGGGTIPSEISFSGLEVRDGNLVERIQHPELGSVTLQYSSDSLRTNAVLKKYKWDLTLEVRREKIAGAVTNVQALRQSDGRKSQTQAISWLSHPSDNRDKARNCALPGLECNFVSNLFLHTNSQSRTVGR